MPKPSDYTPTRRIAMQATMWLILGGTVVLAALVDHNQRRARHVELAAQEIRAGAVAVRLPKSWRARPRAGDDPRLVVQAAEGEPGSAGRELSILRDRLDAPISPAEYLARSFGLQFEKEDLRQSRRWPPRWVSVAGHPGLLVTSERALQMRGDDAIKKDVYACAVLPSLQVITLHLEGLGTPLPNDAAVVSEVAADITLGVEPALEAAIGPLALEGMTVSTLPSGFQLVASNDPLRTDRRLLRAEQKPEVGAGKVEGGRSRFDRAGHEWESFEWTSCELAPCLFPMPQNTSAGLSPIGNSDGLRLDAAVAALLHSRDAALWRGARVVRDEPNLWHVEPVVFSDGAPFPFRAYVLAGESSRALLAIFRGGLGADVQEFDALWKQIVESVQFAAPGDLAALEEAGAAEVSRLRVLGLGQLIADRDEQWRELLETGRDPRHCGWTRVQWDKNVWSGRTETRLWRPMGHVASVVAEWKLNADLSDYECDVTRGDEVDGQPAAEAILQHTDTRQARLNVRTRRGATAQASAALPPQFVPGAVLPLILGKISSTPMLLRTDSFIGTDAMSGSEPLTLIIRPMPDARRPEAGTDAATGAAGAETGLTQPAISSPPRRCFAISVNGSGHMSRWNFRTSGELDYAEFPSGMRWIPSDGRSIRFNFHANGPLAP